MLNTLALGVSEPRSSCIFFRSIVPSPRRSRGSPPAAAFAPEAVSGRASHRARELEEQKFISRARVNNSLLPCLLVSFITSYSTSSSPFPAHSVFIAIIMSISISIFSFWLSSSFPLFFFIYPSTFSPSLSPLLFLLTLALFLFYCLYVISPYIYRYIYFSLIFLSFIVSLSPFSLSYSLPPSFLSSPIVFSFLFSLILSFYIIFPL